MEDFICVYHGTRFNSVSHQLVVLNCCVHNVCRQHFELAFKERGSYSCPICKASTMLPLEESTNLIASQKTIMQLEATEILCDVHSRGDRIFGECLCRREKKVLCEECRHRGEDCCVSGESSLHMEVYIQLREEFNRDDLPAELKHSLRSISTAQSLYDSLRACVNYHQEKERLTLCAVHSTNTAVCLHTATLQLACKECSNADPDAHVDIKPQNVTVLRNAVAQYLTKVHCYSLTIHILKAVKQLSEMVVEHVVRLAVDVGKLKQCDAGSQPAVLRCPSCVKEVSVLHLLPCRDVKHGICEDCLAQQLPEVIVCPLDGRNYTTVTDELLPAEISFLPQPLLSPPVEIQDDDTLDSDLFQSIPQEVKKLPGWRGTKIPPPYLIGPDYHYFQRFATVFPPASDPSETFHPSMRAWSIAPDISQTEAIAITVSSSITLTGVTLACPVDPQGKYIVLQVAISCAETGLVRQAMNTPMEIYGGKVAVDCQFHTQVAIEANTDYTLAVRTKSGVRGVVGLYKGNQFKTKVMSSEGVEEWVIREVEMKGELMGGDNARSGPILRIFYT